MIAYALTIFLGAFLLFQVQPLIGRYILPWFGGSPAVWTTCMLFFQLFLLAGYGYAHLCARYLRPRGQMLLHGALLLAAAALLPVIPTDEWKPASGEGPVLHILLTLTFCLGLPYFILSSTSPLMQAWFYRSHEKTPYILYTLSNTGSLLALVSYPFLIEPALTRNEQASCWSWGFCIFAVLTGWCCCRYWKGLKGSPAARTDSANVTSEKDKAAPGRWTLLLWLALPACASVLLLAVTNEMCRDIAVIPFLWVLPLSLYLLSFIVSFSHPNAYSRLWFGIVYCMAMAGVCTVMYRVSIQVPFLLQIAALSAGLFLCCMVCHGELYRLKPSPRYLTTYYMLIALGGALGGLFVALVAPLLFNSYLELHFGLAGCAMLLMLAQYLDRDSILHRPGFRWMWAVQTVLLLGMCSVLFLQWRRHWPNSLAIHRGFYGVLRVFELYPRKSALNQLILVSGNVRHGTQFTHGERRKWGTTYYSPRSGAAMLMRYFPGQRRKIGMLGLGIGTLATYGREGDVIRFYEIDPAVLRFAESHFTYLKECAGEIQQVLGDARLSLESEEPQEFDILVLDAFTGDSIPVHLLTAEAMQLYLDHLRPDGVMCFNISNWRLDLKPVLKGLADHLGLHAALVPAPADPKKGISPCEWVLLAPNPKILELAEIRKVSRPLKSTKKVRMWTDDFSNLFQIMNFRQIESQ